jgi:hypothetical protein
MNEGDMNMSDAAFATAAYPAYTTRQLMGFVERHEDMSAPMEPETVDTMFAEILRRERVLKGDVTAMTQGERLRHVRAR